MAALSLLHHLSERQADCHWLNLVKRVFNPGDFGSVGHDSPCSSADCDFHGPRCG